jgi:hypothetical protein
MPISLKTSAKIAILGSIQSRQGYGAIESAKARISGAQQDIQTAKQQMGG